MPLRESSPDQKHPKSGEHQRKSTPNLHFAFSHVPLFSSFFLPFLRARPSPNQSSHNLKASKICVAMFL